MHDFFPLLVIGCFHFFGEWIVVARFVFPLSPLGISRGGVDVDVSCNGRHVLPYCNADTVTVPVPACRLYLDVFTNQVPAPFLCLFNVIAKGIVGGSGIKAVGPPALIQGAILEIGLVIQPQAAEALAVTNLRRLAKGCITMDIICHISFAKYFQVKCIQIRMLGRPKMGNRHRQDDGLTGFPLDACDGLPRLAILGGIPLAALQQRYAHMVSAVCVHCDRNGSGINIGERFIIPDVSIGHGFHPYALPDAGDGRVPNAAGI